MTARRSLMLGLVLFVAIVGVVATVWWTGPRPSPTTRVTTTHTSERLRPQAARVAAGRVPRVPKAARITGRVQSIQGSPVSAELCLVEARPARERGGCLRTDEDGRFAFEALRAGAYDLSVSAVGYLPLSQLAVVRQAAEENLELTLEAGGVLVEGVTLDATGGPIAGALVALHSLSRPGPISRGLSDEAGRFSLSGVAGDATASASAVGYARAEQDLVAPASGVSLVLAPGSVIVGEVVAGDPAVGVAGATVTGVAKNGQWSRLLPARTRSDGSFRIEDVTAGTYEVVAHTSDRRSAPRLVHVALGSQSTHVVLDLRSAVELSGRVLLEEAPCASGRVGLRGPLTIIEATDSEGNVTIPGVWAGEYSVSVSCPGGVPQQYELAVGARSPPLQLWRLGRGFEVAGTVRAADGRPATNVSIEVTAAGARPASICSSAHDGTFRCGGLVAGQYHCAVTGPGQIQSTAVSLTIPHDAPIELELLAAGTLRVSVDAPLVASTVVAAGDDGLRRPAQRVGVQRYLLEHLPLGSYEVSVPGATEPARVSLLHDGQVVAISLAVSTAELAGRVLDERGQPVADAWVRVESTEVVGPGGAAPAVLSDDHGEFVVRSLAPGRYRVDVTSVTGEASVDGARAGQHHEIVLASYGSLSGVVRTRRGDPVPAFRLAYARDGTVSTTDVFDRDGRWSLPWLAPGSWTVGIESTAGAATRQVELAPGGSELIRLEAAPPSDSAPAFDLDGTLRGALSGESDDSPSELPDGWRSTEPQTQ